MNAEWERESYIVFVFGEFKQKHVKRRTKNINIYI